jgi:flagellar hook protein FlgE
VSNDGTIVGSNTNGQTRNLAQVVNRGLPQPSRPGPTGQQPVDRTARRASRSSASPSTGSLGTLQSSAVEDSNVDLTAELVRMITAQRNYQANAQTIKTQDQVLQTLVNLRYELRDSPLPARASSHECTITSHESRN